MAAQHSDAPTTPVVEQAVSAADHRAPDPHIRSQQLLGEGQTLLAGALESLQKAHDPAAAAVLLGQASDRIGSAIFFLRQVLRRH